MRKNRGLKIVTFILLGVLCALVSGCGIKSPSLSLSAGIELPDNTPDTQITINNEMTNTNDNASSAANTNTNTSSSASSNTSTQTNTQTQTEVNPVVNGNNNTVN